MGKVILDMAMSLDGFMSGPHGEDWGLHDYFFTPSANTKVFLEESLKSAGAIVMGRRTYDNGAEEEGFDENPYHVTNFVLTHMVPENVLQQPDWLVFVTDGVESILRQAQAVAGDKHILIGGGADIARQFLEAKLVDEVHIQLVHVLFGQGVRLFDRLNIERTTLEAIDVIESTGVTHLQFRVVK